MQAPKFLIAAAVAALFFTGCERSSNSGAPASDKDVNSGSGKASPDSVQPDNTGRNERDRSDSTLTPGDQGTSASDREMTARLRRSITANDQLSTDAKNIKIITRDGKVTLRGPVKNDQERQVIQSIVQQGGVSSVDNQLEVKTSNE